MTLNGVTTADQRYLCGSYASCYYNTAVITTCRPTFNIVIIIIILLQRVRIACNAERCTS